MTHKSMKAAHAARLAAAAFGALIALAVPAAAAPTELGVWIDHTGDGAVEIYTCKDRADRICGRIVWLREPLNAQGQPKRDRFNPNESMKARSICGLPVLGNLAPVEEGGLDNGWIYDPKAGKSYSAAVQAVGKDRLSVTGYLAMKMLGKNFTWSRAPADLPRCDGAPPPA